MKTRYDYITGMEGRVEDAKPRTCRTLKLSGLRGQSQREGMGRDKKAMIQRRLKEGERWSDK